MKTKYSNKSIASVILLVLFLLQIVYLMYRVHQVLILGQAFPPDVKLSAIIAGLSLSALYLLKGYSSPLRRQEEEKSEELKEKDEL